MVLYCSAGSLDSVSFLLGNSVVVEWTPVVLRRLLAYVSVGGTILDVQLQDERMVLYCSADSLESVSFLQGNTLVAEWTSVVLGLNHT